MNAAAKSKTEEHVFEYVPEPDTKKAASSKAGGRSQARDGIDERPGPNAKDTQNAFSKREAAIGNGRRREYETLPTNGNVKYDAFEPPEQKVSKLQAEVADLLRLVESSSTKDGAKIAAGFLGGHPNDVSSELRVLEQRLMALARDGPATWQKSLGKDGGSPGPMAMPGSLVSQLEQMATGIGGGPAPSAVDTDGRVTYELSYVPSTSAVADSSKLAALENTVAEIEKQLGIPDPGCPFADLHTAVGQLQKRVSLLDTNKLDAISQRVKTVLGDIDKMLDKKAQLEDRGNKDDGGRAKKEDDIDQKVSELYEFCHRWSAAAASLPTVVSRLRSLQALHQQSAAFTTRLQALEKQQEELLRMLESTNTAVNDVGNSLQENMTIVRDNMRTLEEKVSKALSK